MQSQQLPTESQIFEDEVLPRTEGADHPAEEMSERRDHSKNLSGKARIELCAKSIHSKGARRFGEEQDTCMTPAFGTTSLWFPMIRGSEAHIQKT